ncbi:MAG: hypothetical protein A2487_15135 [Candidatus Raymondbacteria bacterium RifOxyC12_full_50_8]|uniref:Uncharacterized protein n=1 Tax=Candidatus Raymondbacteria bacterium RIFOXYD12_FULL_49_13 TaxID=1817890 RepID=A0A1F7FK87_UNCRA|nr:MAG: hypothetical protein A2350_10530 [Candidatus Raymondbacteria bacterium RifOxyB12_full_50_8]OGJ91972.1 MAG: hypothetical protein A2248_09360 [Candidatus Raymondbacteria bacterium RIFOXYA2_FULL_49_16]OGJ96361.1 MAG: hypothetical protein A2453_08535 [Candidatus Raymondbacteria bacterium RIFOXYC2_FULL_50_21]OGK03705.1 MAG: hypothetical protein A2487_15135 [Candidatus Raymondbacteria bacterium RifOxyC12_full_50_8]OGK06897.1 MAG: hypothetical protein A2519_11600 [Candidatus Raymondbacteria ba
MRFIAKIKNLTSLMILMNFTFVALLFGSVEFPDIKNSKKPFIDATDNYYPPWDYDDVDG